MFRGSVSGSLRSRQFALRRQAFCRLRERSTVGYRVVSSVLGSCTAGSCTQRRRLCLLRRLSGKCCWWKDKASCLEVVD